MHKFKVEGVNEYTDEPVTLMVRADDAEDAAVIAVERNPEIIVQNVWVQR